MGFRLPSFNLTCRIWDRSAVPAGPYIIAHFGPHRLDSPCQLRAAGKQSTSQDEPHNWVFGPALLLPALTDIRDYFSEVAPLTMNQPDVVEVPQGSGRCYGVALVEDTAKGFANEYRVAFILAGGYRPVPLP